MKKTILILTLLFFTSAMAESVKAPEWKEFCPEKYLEAKQVKEDKDQSYWYWRRLQFETAVDKCERSSDVNTCYDEIRQTEEKKSLKWTAPKNAYNEALERTRQRAGVYDTGNQILPSLSTMLSGLEDE